MPIFTCHPSYGPGSPPGNLPHSHSLRASPSASRPAPPPCPSPCSEGAPCQHLPASLALWLLAGSGPSFLKRLGGEDGSVLSAVTASVLLLCPVFGSSCGSGPFWAQKDMPLFTSSGLGVASAPVVAGLQGPPPCVCLLADPFPPHLCR